MLSGNLVRGSWLPVLTLVCCAALSAQDRADTAMFDRAAPPPQGKRLALVVGIDQYERLGPQASLTYAERDALAVHERLTQMGFQSTLLRMQGGGTKPTTPAAIVGKLDAMCRAAESNGSILFYFSGQGFEGADGKTYLCTSQSDPQRAAITALELATVRKRLAGSRCKQAMLVVDMCRDTHEPIGGRPMQLRDFQKATDVQVLFSAKAGSRSREPGFLTVDEPGRPVEHGVFTHYLLRGLAGAADQGVRSDGFVTFRELAYYVESGLEAYSERHCETFMAPYLLWTGGGSRDVLLCDVAAPEAAASPVRKGGHTGRYSGRDPANRVGSVSPGFAAAIDLGLQWLARHQDQDGRWDCDGFHKHDGAGAEKNGPGNPVHDVGVTALALLAFLSDGSTVESGAHQQVVVNAVAWLRTQQGPDGMFGTYASHDFIYDHAIATYAMCEAFGLSTDDSLQQTAQRGLDYLESHRNPHGVWRYQPRDNDNDTSVTSWCLAAYVTGDYFGLRVDQEALRVGAAYLQGVSDPTGRHGYTKQGERSSRKPGDHSQRFPTEKGEAMTAAGLFMRFLLGQRPSREPVMAAAGNLLLSQPPKWDVAAGTIDAYYWYYASQAMFRMGGGWWRDWQAHLQRAVVDTQRRNEKDRSSLGSWDPVGVWDEDGGRIFTTAMLVLSLQAGHRYL